MSDVTFILWLQRFSSEFLDKFFILTTMMGNPEYYMIIIPFLYWCVNKKQAFRFTMFFLISSYTNSVIKGSTGRSRPPADQVRILYGESTGGSTSFPSGHAQGTAALWLYASYYFKRMWVTILAIVIIALVSISRLYLGLHYPIDIIVGIALAAVILVIYNLLYEPTANIIGSLPFVFRLIIPFLLIPILLMLPGHDKGMVVGFSIGLLSGYQLQERYLYFDESGSIIEQVIKFILGIAGLFGLKTGLKMLFASSDIIQISPLIADVIRYTAVGLWATYGAPWVFVKLGLSKKNRRWKYVF